MACVSSASRKIDIVSIVKPITKYAVTILDPTTIRYHLEKAVHLACSGRPGPVWIDIPLDVQAFPVDPDTLSGFDPAELDDRVRRCGSRGAVAGIIEALNRSTRPLVFAGNGIRLARAEQEFAEVIRLLNVPVVATWCAADLISSDDPLFVGRPGSVASRGANFALQNCDFLLSVGARLDFAITGYAPDKLAREAHKVMVDIDAAELAKLSPHIQTPVCADARAFLAASSSRSAAASDTVDRTAWNDRCADWKTRYPLVTPEHRKPEGPVSIYHLAEVIGTETTSSDVMVSGSSGSGIEIFLLACPTRTGQRIYHTAGSGRDGLRDSRRASPRAWPPDGRARCASMATAGFSSTSRSSRPSRASGSRSSSSSSTTTGMPRSARRKRTTSDRRTSDATRAPA